MKKTLFALFVLVAILVTSCATASPSAHDVAVELATIQASGQGPQEVAPQPISGTPSAPVSGWKLQDPPLPTYATLPHDLLDVITYVAPPENCAVANDVKQTCSTREGQATNGTTTLAPNTALVMTGDKISLKRNGVILANRPSAESVHDLWVLLNIGDTPVDVEINAPEGSFRGYFTADEWSPLMLAHLRDLHLERFLAPWDHNDFTPTPVANCDHPNAGCPNTNVRTLVYQNGEWIRASIGWYVEWNVNYWRSE